MSGIYKFGVMLLFALVLTPNILAVILPYESWPYTNAPMFAQYVAPETARYRFHLVLESGAERKDLGFYSVGANWSLWRFFMKYVYGSADAKSVFSVFPADSPEEFTKRLTVFFAAFYREYQKRGGRAGDRLQLSIDSLDSNNESKLAAVVGYFDTHLGLFIRNPELVR